MDIQLIKATVKDAEQIWTMQTESFAELLDRYQDFETSPACEPIDKVICRLEQSNTYYYFIKADEKIAGAIRVVDNSDGSWKRISPLFILPEFRNQGIAQKAIEKAEAIHGNTGWSLDTILQEKGNCHLYEKMGYRQTGETKIINEKMTLVFYRKE